MQMNTKNENYEFVTIMLKMVGTSCNMCCEYCYEHVSKIERKEFSTWIEVQEYLKGYIHYKHIFIVFHGGEPLLTPIKEIEKILEYIKDNFKNEYNIQFQTNGTLLNDNWVRLFQKYEPNLSLSISLDPLGDRDLRKAKGFNYRDIVIKNIMKYNNSILNIGIISVAHKLNIDSFEVFIEELIEVGIHSLTVNKYQVSGEKEDYYISEKEYVDLIIKLSRQYILKGWYKNINIQPIDSLFYKNGSKICTYLADENKCSYFHTYYGENDTTLYCDHVTGNKPPKMPEKCRVCDIYSKCGGGCLMEKKEPDFCEARHKLIKFLKEVRP